jgi:hypothetical protein
MHQISNVHITKGSGIRPLICRLFLQKPKNHTSPPSPAAIRISSRPSVPSGRGTASAGKKRVVAPRATARLHAMISKDLCPDTQSKAETQGHADAQRTINFTFITALVLDRTMQRLSDSTASQQHMGVQNLSGAWAVCLSGVTVLRRTMQRQCISTVSQLHRGMTALSTSWAACLRRAKVFHRTWLRLCDCTTLQRHKGM